MWGSTKGPGKWPIRWLALSITSSLSQQLLLTPQPCFNLGLLAYWTTVSLEGAPVTQVSGCQFVDPVASFHTCVTEPTCPINTFGHQGNQHPMQAHPNQQLQHQSTCMQQGLQPYSGCSAEYIVGVHGCALMLGWLFGHVHGCACMCYVL